MFLLLRSPSVAGTVFVNATDALSLSATEGDVANFSSDLLETLAFNFSDVASVVVQLNRSESFNVSLTEAAVVTAVAPANIAGTDTLSVSVAEIAAVNVAVAGTDTLSVSDTETGAVTVRDVLIAGTDTVAVSIAEIGTVDRRDFNQIFIDDDETLAISLDERATLEKNYPVSRIKFELGAWSIKFRMRN